MILGWVGLNKTQRVTQEAGGCFKSRLLHTRHSVPKEVRTSQVAPGKKFQGFWDTVYKTWHYVEYLNAS